MISHLRMGMGRFFLKPLSHPTFNTGPNQLGLTFPCSFRVITEMQLVGRREVP